MEASGTCPYRDDFSSSGYAHSMQYVPTKTEHQTFHIAYAQEQCEAQHANLTTQ